MKIITLGLILLFGLTGCYPILYYETPRYMTSPMYIGPWQWIYIDHPKPPMFHERHKHRWILRLH